MTEPASETRLWRPGGFCADPWRRPAPDAAPPFAAPALLGLDAYLALDAATRAAHADALAVELLPGEPLEAIVPHLGRLPMVALAFPGFADGRSYSKAALLRSRHGYGGEIRATGEVLIDQVAHMLRCGFTTLSVSHPVALARLAAGTAPGLPGHYQPSPAAAGRAGRYAWRRLPAA